MGYTHTLASRYWFVGANTLDTHKYIPTPKIVEQTHNIDVDVYSFPTESKIWCSMNNAKITIGLTYIIVPILCIPQYLAFSIITVQNVESDPPNEEYLVSVTIPLLLSST